MKKLVVSMLVMLTVAFFGCTSTGTPEAQPAPEPVEETAEAPTDATVVTEEAAVAPVEPREPEDVSEDVTTDSSGSDE